MVYTKQDTATLRSENIVAYDFMYVLGHEQKQFDLIRLFTCAHYLLVRKDKFTPLCTM